MPILFAVLIALSILLVMTTSAVCLPIGIGLLLFWTISISRKEDMMTELRKIPLVQGLTLWLFGATTITCFSIVSYLVLSVFSLYFSHVNSLYGYYEFN